MVQMTRWQHRIVDGSDYAVVESMVRTPMFYCCITRWLPLAQRQAVRT